MAEREPRHGEQLPWRLGRRRTAKGSDPARRAEEAARISLRRWLGWTQGAQLAVLRMRPGSREGAMSADVHARSSLAAGLRGLSEPRANTRGLWGQKWLGGGSRWCGPAAGRMRSGSPRPSGRVTRTSGLGRVALPWAGFAHP